MGVGDNNETLCEQYELDLTRYVAGDYERIKEFKGLTDHLHSCASCGKRLSDYRNLIAILRGGYEKPDEAQKVIDQIIKNCAESGPSDGSGSINVSPLIWNGRGYLSMKEYETALKQFDAALVLDPKSKDALLNKGIALLYLNKPQEAVKALEQLISFHGS